MADRARDLRPQLRSILATVLGIQIFWFYLLASLRTSGGVDDVLSGASTDRSRLILVGCAQLLFLLLHPRIINSFGFFTELADFADRGPYQTVVALGDWLEKRVDLKIFRDRSAWSESPWLSGLAIFYWFVINFLAMRLSGQFSTPLFALSALSVWMWSSPRALMWVPISCITLFLTMWVAKTQLLQISSAGLFLSFLSIYSYCFFSYSSRAAAIDLGAWARSLVRPMSVFVVAFLLANYFLPDDKTKAHFVQAKSSLAQKIAQHTGKSAGAKKSKGAPGPKNSQGGPNSSSGSGGDGDPNGKGDPKGRGNTGEENGGDPSQKNSNGALANMNGRDGGNKNGPQAKSGGRADNSSGGSGGEGGDDEASSGSQSANGGTENRADNGRDDGNESRRNQERPADLAKKTEKIQKLLDWLESAAKAVLALILLFIVARFLFSSPPATKKMAERRDRKKMKSLLNEIEALYSQKFASQKDEIMATYHTYLNAMTTIGVKKLEWQTPEQYCQEISKFGSQHSEISKTLTKSFTRVYYGESEISDTEFKEFRQRARQIKRIVA